MQVDLHTKDGQTQGQIDLLDDVFAVEPNENAMHKAVVAYLAHKRQGTHKTKTRKDVRGGGRKPWRQKGRGTARAGSIRSPLWVGGGTIHGPQPHKYNFKLSRKVRQLAKKSALSLRLAENNMKVVVDFTFEEIKTKQLADVLKNLNVYGESTLILLPKEDYNLFMSGRNIDKLTIYPAEQVSTYDILKHKNVLLFEGAAKSLNTAFSN